jgi:2-isopropylmalate synthase
MNSIKIFDTTLRDGEQSPGATLTSKEKLTVAYALADLGVDIIEAGFPIASDDEYNAVKDIAKKVKGPVICGLARTTEKDIYRCYEAVKYSDRPRIHAFIATSEIHMKKKLKMSPEEVLETAEKSVRYAKSLCPEVEFCLEDATRTEYPFMIKVIKTAIESGASIINIPDTAGYAVPAEIKKRFLYVFRKIGDLINEKNVQLSIHCHDDLGNAVSNSLTAIKSGATQVECTINGIGERAGNASLEEIVMNLVTRKDYYKKITNVNTKLLYPTSNIVKDLTGLIVPRNKAIVGENAFAHEAGIHQAGVIACRDTYEIMKSEDVGWVGNQLVIGKHSGKNAIKQILEDNNIEVSEDKLKEITSKLKIMADTKKNISHEDILEASRA